MTDAQFDVRLDFLQELSVLHKFHVVPGFHSTNFTLCQFFIALTHSLDMLTFLTYIFINIKTLKVQQSPLFLLMTKTKFENIYIKMGSFILYQI